MCTSLLLSNSLFVIYWSDDLYINNFLFWNHLCNRFAIIIASGSICGFISSFMGSFVWRLNDIGMFRLLLFSFEINCGTFCHSRLISLNSLNKHEFVTSKVIYRDHLTYHWILGVSLNWVNSEVNVRLKTIKWHSMDLGSMPIFHK